MLVPVLIPIAFQAVPKGCRKERPASDNWAAVAEFIDVEEAAAPVICRGKVTPGWKDWSKPGNPNTKQDEDEEVAPEAAWVTWRRIGDTCWKNSSEDPIAILNERLTYCGQRDWETRRLRQGAAEARLAALMAEICNTFRYIGGAVYERCEEPGWRVSISDRYWSSPAEPEITLCDNDPGRFRLDEFPEARRRLDQLIDAGGYKVTRVTKKRFPGYSLKHRIRATLCYLDPSQLRRPPGFALVNGGRLVDIIKGAAEVPIKDINHLLADFRPELLPPGIDLAAARLRDAVVAFQAVVDQASKPDESPCAGAA